MPIDTSPRQISGPAGTVVAQSTTNLSSISKEKAVAPMQDGGGRR